MGRGTDNREALVAAAAGLFWQKGFAATSLADISGASGVPVGNVYYYFRTKSDFAMAVAEVFVAETEAMLEEVAASTADPRGRLNALVGRLSRAAPGRVEHGCPIALCVRDFRVPAPEASARAAEAFSLLIGFIARECGRTGRRPSLALATGRAAIAEWQGGIALAHAMREASVLAESFRRMEKLLSGGRAE